MKKIYLFCLFVLGLIFTRCSTDVDLIAPYKETTIVYGLLSPVDSVQYIRVAKAYLGEGNALTMATVNDSIYYSDAAISVVLQRWENDILRDSTILVRDENIVKDPGIFSNQPNVLYRTVKDPVNHTDSIYKSSDYKIRIYNRITGNVVTSSTPIVGDIGITIPSPNVNVTVNMVSNQQSSVKWSSSRNGKIYNLVIRTLYEEKEITPPFNVSIKAADWTFPDQEVNNDTITQVMEINFQGEDYFKNLAIKILPAIGIERKFLGLDYIFTIGAEDFYTYYLVNQPSLSINQSVPQFTNIENGLGIFSSRNITTLRNKQLDVSSLDSLRNGQYTSNLSFQ